jgi:hypothetical protein
MPSGVMGMAEQLLGEYLKGIAKTVVQYKDR